eukprot:768732-Hanusia_phi.AAC.8
MGVGRGPGGEKRNRGTRVFDGWGGEPLLLCCSRVKKQLSTAAADESLVPAQSHPPFPTFPKSRLFSPSPEELLSRKEGQTKDSAPLLRSIVIADNFIPFRQQPIFDRAPWIQSKQ